MFTPFSRSAAASPASLRGLEESSSAISRRISSWTAPAATAPEARPVRGNAPLQTGTPALKKDLNSFIPHLHNRYLSRHARETVET
mgnify:CR=1 FL=1